VDSIDPHDRSSGFGIFSSWKVREVVMGILVDATIVAPCTPVTKYHFHAAIEAPIARATQFGWYLVRAAIGLCQHCSSNMIKTGTGWATIGEDGATHCSDQTTICTRQPSDFIGQDYQACGKLVR
jgi:hypothetical protein